MLRKIIEIDKEKCNGCELCVKACHEGAIGMVDGKATLLRDDYCDGLGDCLPICPTNAITFVEREAKAYNEKEVKKSITEKLSCGCPGTNSKTIERGNVAVGHIEAATELNQWPVQINLVPVNAPYFENANLLIAADCAAYAYGNFHNEFMRNKITLIGCPKLDEGDYSKKLLSILNNNNIKSVTVVRMEVPCCGGIENVVIKALKESGKMLPWQIMTLSTNGEILE